MTNWERVLSPRDKLSRFFLYFNEFFVLKCFTFFYILTYEHGTRKEKIQKTERKTKHYTSQTNTQLHTYKEENKRNKNPVPSFLFT